MNAAKEKKMKRKQALEKSLQVQKSIKAAQKVTDLMSLYPAFQKYERNGVSAELVSSSSKEVSAETLQWAYTLCKRNMQEMYEAAWGWSDKKKMRELQHPDAHFLIVNQQRDSTAMVPQKHLAYVHFRYEEEGGEPVLYVYEVQVEDEYQRKGIAKLVMKMMELVAWRLNFYSVMLTVMQANLSAIALYTSLGYAKHATSPPPSQDGKTGYFILVKRVPSKRQ